MGKASHQNYHFIQAEKYRLDLVIMSFLASHFYTIIAELKSEAIDETYTIYGI